MKHTPGPWKVGTHGALSVSVDDENGRSLAELWARSHAPEDLDETEANARLIAAAPELLDLVRRFAHGDMKLPHSEYDMNLRAEARALLARIDGKEEE